MSNELLSYEQCTRTRRIQYCLESIDEYINNQQLVQNGILTILQLISIPN